MWPSGCNGCWACGRLEQKWIWMGTRTTTTIMAMCSAFRQPSGSIRTIDIAAALHRKEAHEEKTKDHYHGHAGKVLPELAKTAKNSPKSIADVTASQQPAGRRHYLCSIDCRASTSTSLSQIMLQHLSSCGPIRRSVEKVVYRNLSVQSPSQS